MALRAIFSLVDMAQSCSSCGSRTKEETLLVQPCLATTRFVDRTSYDEEVGEENDAKNRTFDHSGVASLCSHPNIWRPLQCRSRGARQSKKKPNCGCLRQGNQKTVQRLAVGVPVGIPVQVNNVLGCLQKSQEKLSARCAAAAMNVTRMCDSDANRLCSGVVAGAPGNIVGCLTMARNVVSPQCNAALDAAGLR